MKKYRNYKLIGILVLSLLLPYFYTGKVWAEEIDPIAQNTEADAEWNIQCINAEKSYQESKKYEKIKVAVIDSGLDYDEDIPFVEREDFLEEEETETQPLYEDYTGHGTSVAGLICAKENDDRVSGIAANVELYSARVLDAENKAPINRVVKAIDWAISKNVKIIHMSFGTKERSRALREAVQRAQEAGILIIAAAGNDGTAAEDESTIEYPAAYPEVMAVGATNTRNAKSELSSSGEEMDVVAPGDQILSAGAFGGLTVDEGTSFAAAQVTGVAAVLWGKYPHKSSEFIRSLLTASANDTAVSGDCGEGMIDYQEAKADYQTLESGYQYFKKMGKNEKDAVKCAVDTVRDNEKEIESHDDVNYVNGSWGPIRNSNDKITGYYHQKLLNGIKISNINIVKIGAIAPDYVSSMAKMGVNPFFHGKGNYLANTQYLYAAAYSYLYGDGRMPNYGTAFKDYKNPFKEIKTDPKKEKKDVKGRLEKTFSAALGHYEKENPKLKFNTKKKKGYFLLGIALHNITDAFSHSVCRNMDVMQRIANKKIKLPSDTKKLSEKQRIEESLKQMGRDMKKGWMRVVHQESSLGKEKKKDCQARYWRRMAAIPKIVTKKDGTKEKVNDKISNPFVETYKLFYDNLVVADNVTVLKDFYSLSQKVARQLVNSFDAKHKICLGNMASVLRQFEKEKSAIKDYEFSLFGLNANWNAILESEAKYKAVHKVSEFVETISDIKNIKVTFGKNEKMVYVRSSKLASNRCLCQVYSNKKNLFNITTEREIVKKRGDKKREIKKIPQTKVWYRELSEQENNAIYIRVFRVIGMDVDEEEKGKSINGKKYCQEIKIPISAHITLKWGKKGRNYKKTYTIKPGKTLNLKTEISRLIKKSKKNKKTDLKEVKSWTRKKGNSKIKYSKNAKIVYKYIGAGNFTLNAKY